MTRKESNNLLREMRKTGCVPMFSTEYGTTAHAKVDDEYIRFSGYGSWACKNTFEEFYIYVSDYELIEKKDWDYYEWGL